MDNSHICPADLQHFIKIDINQIDVQLVMSEYENILSSSIPVSHPSNEFHAAASDLSENALPQN